MYCVNYDDRITLDASVLLLFQKLSSCLKPYEESQVIRQCLIDYLADCNIETSACGMYEMRQSPTDWIVEQQKKANAVLCVCNREFLRTGSRLPWTTTRKLFTHCFTLFQGDLQRNQHDEIWGRTRLVYRAILLRVGLMPAERNQTLMAVLYLQTDWCQQLRMANEPLNAEGYPFPKWSSARA